VAKSVERVEGVRSAELNFASGSLVLEYEASTDPRAEVLKVVRDAGHGIEPLEGGRVPQGHGSVWAQGHEATTAVSGVLLVAGWLFSHGGSPFAPVAYAAAIVVGGWLTARRGALALRARTLDMNVLMSLAVAGAAAIGEWQEGAMVVFLFSLGQILEARALARTRASIRSLVDLTPPRARVLRDGREMFVAPDQVGVGETLVVKPGERIGLDGTVSGGGSAVDESPITGESVPAERTIGDRVFAGSLSMSGILHLEVTSPAADSTLARMVHLVEEAQAARAPMQRLVDRFTRWYTPAVVVAAAAVAVVPPLLGLAIGADWGGFAPWFYRALVMLVVSCPCALVISTPVAIVSAITRATRDGILVKGGVFLEAAAAVRAVAFDKTGTLTRGMPEITDIVPCDGSDARQVLAVAAALEVGSTHPVAAAVLRAAAGAAVDVRHADSFRQEAGVGVRGSVSGVRYTLGSPSSAHDAAPIPADVGEVIERLEGEGKTVLALAAEAGVIALLAVADEPREGAREAVAALRLAGIAHVVMLTGDNERTAAAVASTAGVTEVRARLLPEEKVDAVRDLRERFGSVLMVGDGVNDAPALAAADVGVAMGAAASDVALETADVALMSEDLGAVAELVLLGRRTVTTVKANVGFSIVVKAFVLALALVGTASLWMAVFADMGVSLLVTLNGLRLLRSRRV